MSACEKCWRDAGGDPDRYHQLLIERKNSPCTPEEQAGGNDAGWCDICKRQTVHLYTKKCVNYRNPEHLQEYEKQKLATHNQQE